MKLLTTIATLLLTFSAFSQEFIEYRDFQFYQNGAEISFEEVTELTKEFEVTKVAFRQGRRDYAASQDVWRARQRNLINGSLACSAFLSASAGIGSGHYMATGGIFGNGSYDPAEIQAAYTFGAISIGGMIYYGRLLATKKKFKKRADRKFSKTAQKLNELFY